MCVYFCLHVLALLRQDLQDKLNAFTQFNLCFEFTIWQSTIITQVATYKFLGMATPSLIKMLIINTISINVYPMKSC